MVGQMPSLAYCGRRQKSKDSRVIEQLEATMMLTENGTKRKKVKPTMEFVRHSRDVYSHIHRNVKKAANDHSVSVASNTQTVLSTRAGAGPDHARHTNLGTTSCIALFRFFKKSKFVFREGSSPRVLACKMLNKNNLKHAGRHFIGMQLWYMQVRRMYTVL